MSKEHPDFYDGIVRTEERLRAYHDARAERIQRERMELYYETKAAILRDADSQDNRARQRRGGSSIVDVLFPKEREDVDELTKELKLKAHRSRAEAAAERQAADLVALIRKELKSKGKARR